MNSFLNIVQIRDCLLRISSTSPRIASPIIILLATTCPLHYHDRLMMMRRTTVVTLTWIMILNMMRVRAIISVFLFRMVHWLMPRRFTRSIWSSIIWTVGSIMNINCTITSYCMDKWSLISMISGLLTLQHIRTRVIGLRWSCPNCYWLNFSSSVIIVVRYIGIRLNVGWFLNPGRINYSSGITLFGSISISLNKSRVFFNVKILFTLTWFQDIWCAHCLFSFLFLSSILRSYYFCWRISSCSQWVDYFYSWISFFKIYSSNY